VVEEHLSGRPQLRRQGEQLLIFSAASRHSLLAYLEKFQAFIATNPSLELEDLAYSLAQREHRLAHRAALVADNIEQTLARLRLLLTGELPVDGGCWISPFDGIEKGEAETALGAPAQMAAAYCCGAKLNLSALYSEGGNRISAGI
ncbi:hypothetical protein ACFSVK_24855, partial [Azorhizophilus paspali]|uniref:CurL C-terminal domain-containing protein n=1 Tax=Azorhizophilus paspali TaxID=69963 RepID=UPI0036263738